MVVALVFGQHALVGASRPTVALVAAGLHGVVLASLYAKRDVRRELSALSGAAVPAVLFALVILAVVWSLSPLAPGPARSGLIVPGAPTQGAIDAALTLSELAKLMGLASLFLVGIVVGGRADRLRFMLRCTAVGGLIYLSVFLGLSAFLGDELYGAAKFTAQNRFTAAFISANTAATLSGLLLLLAWSRLLLAPAEVPHRRADAATFVRRNGVELVLAPVAIAALLLTASRAGVILTGGCALALSAVAASTRSSRERRGWLALGAGLVLALAMLSGGALFGERLAALNQDVDVRTGIFAAHWSAVREAPWWGYGLGSFDIVNRSLITPATFDLLAPVGAAHNVYLQWLEQAGVLGAAPMFACLGWIVAVLSLGLMRSGRATAASLAAVAAASALILSHGVVDYALEVPSMSAQWTLLLGGGYAVALRTLRERRLADQRRAQSRRRRSGSRRRRAKTLASLESTSTPVTVPVRAEAASPRGEGDQGN